MHEEASQDDKSGRKALESLLFEVPLDDEACASSAVTVGDDVNDEVGDAQDLVDRAFAAFVSAHKLDLNIFHSAEWANLLATADESCYNVPTTLLARARPSIFPTSRPCMASLTADEGYK